MPELGEVAHAAAILRRTLLNKRILSVTCQSDDLLYVNPLTHEIFRNALENKEISNVGRHGKYFMVEIAGNATLVLHFGMTGWLRACNLSNKEQIDSILRMDGTDRFPKASQWPPKFTKFMLRTDTVELAFSDPRRLARIRLINSPLSESYKFEPLSKLGTDFSQVQPPASDMVSIILKRRVPVKSLLLDQTLFSGIGNWMADEILHLARIHPEQYSNTLGVKHAEILYEKLLEVCRLTVEVEGDSTQFPEHWLMLHRWGKSQRKKEVQRTPSGHIVSFVSVGGRTSCYIPELQKKFREVKDSDSDLVKEEVKEIPTKKRVKTK